MTHDELIARLRQDDTDFWHCEAADRIEALVKVRREDALELLAAHGQAQEAYEAQLKAEARAERLEAAVIAAAKIGQIVGFLGEDEGRIEAFREACGPELWAKARAALKGDDHE